MEPSKIVSDSAEFQSKKRVTPLEHLMPIDTNNFVLAPLGTGRRVGVFSRTAMGCHSQKI
jgi:hypothetical protein